MKGIDRRSWEDNILIDLQEVGRGGMDWIALAEDRDRWWAPVNVVMKFGVPYNTVNFLPSRGPFFPSQEGWNQHFVQTWNLDCIAKVIHVI